MGSKAATIEKISNKANNLFVLDISPSSLFINFIIKDKNSFYTYPNKKTYNPHGTNVPYRQTFCIIYFPLVIEHLFCYYSIIISTYHTSKEVNNGKRA